jgi:uncharacterized protein (TIGR03437 family)
MIRRRSQKTYDGQLRQSAQRRVPGTETVHTIIRNTRLLVVFGAACAMATGLRAQGVITTIAGVDPTFTGCGQLATNVPIGYVNGVAVDTAGNVYFTDPLEHLVLKIAAADGTLSVVAGNGIAGYSGDGGPAKSAAIASTDSPEQYTGVAAAVSLGGIVVDATGDVFFGDGVYVREVTPDGNINTIAGGGTLGPGNGTPATQVALGPVNGLALDNAGNLYIAENNRVVVMSLQNGTIQPFAGNPTNGFAGDGGPASKATLSQPSGLAFDPQGNLYIADGDHVNIPARIRKVTPQGLISTIAGGGNQVPASGVSPLNLNLGFATGVAVDASGTVYAFAPFSGFLLKFSSNTTTLMTNPVPTIFTTDIPASQAYLAGHRANDNSGLAIDSAGNLYVADSRDGRVAKIDSHSFLTTLAGNGTYGFGGDGGPAMDAFIEGPTQMTQTPDGTIYVLDSLNAAVRAISPSGVIRSVLNALNYPPLGNAEALNGIASDSSGNIYVLLQHRLLQISPTGKQTYIIFGGSNTSGPAFSANIVNAGGLARDTAGNLYVSDVGANMIYKITTDNMIHAIAGNGTLAVSADGSMAVSSPVSAPTSLLADNMGGVYFEEQPSGGKSNVVRYITPGGLLKSIAGTGTPGYSGDGSLALQANMQMLKRAGMALDPAGNLYISDSVNSRVRVVNPGGFIQTYAGNGMSIVAGDGGLAKQASFVIPSGLLVDAKGDLLISDVAGNRIREVLAMPPMVSVSPASLSFSGKAGGAITAPKVITISSAVPGMVFSVSATQGANWLTIGVSSGATPQVLDIRADPANLTPGSYQATLTIGVLNGSPVNTNIPVTFQVAAGGNPQLAVDSSSLTFTFPRNPTNTLTDQLRVQNSGTGSLAFSVAVTTASGGGWLSVAPQSGTAAPNAPGVIAFTANPAGLATGTYTGTATISTSPTNQSISVPVTMTISSLDQAIQLSHSALSFIGVEAGGILPAASFAVTNVGRAAMKFGVSTTTLSGGPQWLSATPASGTATAGGVSPVVTVQVNQVGLAPGFYYGQVRVDATGAANSPQVATIALHVLAAGQDPGPQVTPAEIVFHTVAGEPPPGSSSIQVYNISATPQAYVSSVVTNNPNYQVALNPANGFLSLSAPTRIVVQPLTAGLTAGVYNGQLTLQFSDGTLQRVGLRTIVASAASATATATDTEPRTSGGCTPTQLLPIITTLGQSFGVPAAWPVALESQVRDDCGNPVSAGSVKVSFSNGDPPLSLLPLQSGVWHTTWQSGTTTGPVTLTVTATNAAQTLTGTRVISGGLGDTSPAPVLAAAESGASFAANVPLAPGSIISLFGSSLANGTASTPGVPLGTTLAGATVIMAGVQVPLLYGSNGQVNAVVPAGIGTNTTQQVLVQRDNTYSVPISVNVAASEPAVFPYPLPGDPPTQGAIVNAISYAVADPKAPVTAGDALAIFCTGLGVVNPAVPDGAAAPSSPPANTVATPTVTIGGKNAVPFFSGLAPGFVGLYQIDVTVPSGVTPGNQVPVVLSIAGETSPPVTIAVK